MPLYALYKEKEVATHVPHRKIKRLEVIKVR